MKFKDFQAPVLFSSTFKALNLGEKLKYFLGFVGTLKTDIMSPGTVIHCDFVSHFSGLKWEQRCWHQKAGIFDLILSQKMEMLGHFHCHSRLNIDETKPLKRPRQQSMQYASCTNHSCCHTLQRRAVHRR